MCICRYVHRELIEKVFYLRQFDKDVCVQLALAFTSSVMAPGEQACIHTCIYAYLHACIHA